MVHSMFMRCKLSQAARSADNSLTTTLGTA
jgi:hypothetical protein